jgi:AraC-like DNA-binding protein
VPLELGSPPDLEQWLSKEQYLALWAEVMEQVEDAAFPLRVAASPGARAHNVLFFVCMTQPNLEEALRAFCRYARIYTSVCQFEFQVGEGAGQLILRRNIQWRPELQFADEYAMAELVHSARFMTQLDWVPRSVQFVHPEPPETRHLREFFRCPLHFGCASAGFTVDRETLAHPMVTADPALAAYFEHQVSESLERFSPSEEPLVTQVRRALSEGFKSGVPDLNQVARQLAMSPRTLRRRLEEAGTSFQQLLEETRCALARRYLKAMSLPLGEVAFLLGYSEPSAFHRAFRRWTGMTPQEYRQRAQPRPV